jgi:calcium/calmodulin-dependent protein kinase I
LTGGSEGYTAPEILTTLDYDPKKCDIFALGVFVFVLFLGLRPFLTNHPQKEDKYWNLIK